MRLTLNGVPQEEKSKKEIVSNSDCTVQVTVETDSEAEIDFFVIAVI